MNQLLLTIYNPHTSAIYINIYSNTPFTTEKEENMRKKAEYFCSKLQMKGSILQNPFPLLNLIVFLIYSAAHSSLVWQYRQWEKEGLDNLEFVELLDLFLQNCVHSVSNRNIAVSTSVDISSNPTPSSLFHPENIPFALWNSCPKIGLESGDESHNSSFREIDGNK